MELEKLFFTQDDAQFVHEQSLKVLAETGCVFDDDKALDIFKKNGAPPVLKEQLRSWISVR